MEPEQGPLPGEIASHTLQWLELLITVAAWASLLALAVGAVIIAFRSGRPGGYLMFSAVVAFVAGVLAYAPYFQNLPINYPQIGPAIARALPLVPLILFSIGFFRLAWSLRGDSAVSDDQ